VATRTEASVQASVKAPSKMASYLELGNYSSHSSDSEGTSVFKRFRKEIIEKEVGLNNKIADLEAKVEQLQLQIPKPLSEEIATSANKELH
jgi:hypothetical protein